MVARHCQRPMTALQRLSAIIFLCHRRMTMTRPLRRFCAQVTLNEIMQISKKLSVSDAYKLRHTHHKQPWCSVVTLQNTDKEAILPLSSNVQTLKCCQLQGALPPEPLTRGSAPGPRWGLCPQTPVIGSRSALAINVSTGAAQNFPQNKPCPKICQILRFCDFFVVLSCPGYTFFSQLRPGRTPGRILTICGLNDASSPKDVPFGNLDHDPQY